jgi:3'-phosphoadenosine 5'-phosphosulfate sulfotransferase (PAPS reductase)/FAD synthetase
MNPDLSKEQDQLILISGGLASFEAARRVISKFGKERVKLWFFDTLIEDEDLYRFLDEIEKSLGVPITKFADGRNPWEVFKDERYIGNSHADLCSKNLKRVLLEKLLRKEYPQKDVILYFGLEWSEEHRIKALQPRWEQKGYKVDFPLAWEPLLFAEDYRKISESIGIPIPRLYNLGFGHNNCGGACIKAGIQQWALLYEKFPERYKWHEEKEQELRKHLRKNVSILRNRRGGRTRPMTLRFLRWRLEKTQDKPTKDVVDESTCSCFFNFSELEEGAYYEIKKQA